MKINKRIPRFLKLDKNIFPSLRGDYQLVKNFKYFEFTEKGLEAELEKWMKIEVLNKQVIAEYELFERGDYDRLAEHPFWKGEEEYLLNAYMLLHRNFIHKMEKSKYATSRNTVSAVAETCVSFLQRHNETLYCVSRSCDISLGFLAALLTLRIIMKKYKLKNIHWTITTPHIYVNNKELTIKQFKTKKKQSGFIFNMRREK